jgi:hypothetical protein
MGRKRYIRTDIPQVCTLKSIESIAKGKFFDTPFAREAIIKAKREADDVGAPYSDLRFFINTDTGEWCHYIVKKRVH